MDEIRRRLPKELYLLMIDKYFEQSSCVSLALSGAFDEFSSVYTPSRKRKGLVINEQCFFLTPASWILFFNQHISLESISILNMNHLYWLPGQLLESTIMQMPELKELSIKGTQVCTVRQVAKILQHCPNILKLDFTFTEKTEEEISNGLKKENISLDSLTKSFQKLTSLKISTTTVPDPDPYKDPWFIIITKLLSICRDCTDLSIEVTYASKPLDFPRLTFDHLMAMQRVREEVERDWHHRLEWMKSLTSLVVIKLGPFASDLCGERVVSLLLDDLLCDYLFPPTENQIIPARPIKTIWIQDFEVYPWAPLEYSSPGCLKSYRSGDPRSGDEEDVEPFQNLEHLGAMIGLDFSQPLLSLQKLKYAFGRASKDEQFYQFCEAHPELENVSVDYWFNRSTVPNNKLCRLPKLKSFSCDRFITKEYIEAMTEAYPNLEILKLTTSHPVTVPYDDDAVLSALGFPKLTSLTLCGFRLWDGAFLLEIIEKCPKLQILHLDSDSMEPSSFQLNLKRFLRQATKLRDFKLEWSHEDGEYPATVLLYLKAILKESVNLERLSP